MGRTCAFLDPFLAPGQVIGFISQVKLASSVLRPLRGWGAGVGCLHWSWCSFTRVPTAAALPSTLSLNLRDRTGAAILGSLTARGIQKVKL